MGYRNPIAMATSTVLDIASKAAAAGLNSPKQLVAFTLGFASVSGHTSPSSKPVLYYWPVAVRAELARLVAAAGCLEIEETPNLSTVNKAEFGSKSGIPLLKHGELKMSQSGAIERYLADIAPKFAGLTPQQRAVDNMFAALKEDFIQGLAKVTADRSNVPETLGALLDAWIPVVESRMPSTGFINGMPFPTMADLAVLNIRKAYMPFGGVYKLAGDPDGTKLFAKYPKFNALAERAAAADGVKQYLASSKSFNTPAMGL